MSKALLFTCPKCGRQFAAVSDRSWPISNRPTFHRSFLGFRGTRCPHGETTFQAKLPIGDVVARAIALVPLLALMAFYGAIVSLGLIQTVKWSTWVLVAFFLCLTGSMLYALVKSATTRGARAIATTLAPDAPTESDTNSREAQADPDPQSTTAQESPPESTLVATISCASCKQTFIGAEKPGGLCPLCGKPVSGEKPPEEAASTNAPPRH